MEGVSRDVDLMIEAKDKEQAVLMLYRIYGLESVKWESLRPEKKQSVDAKGEIGADEEGDAGEGDAEGEEGTNTRKRGRTRNAKKDAQVGVGAIEGADAEADMNIEESPKKRTRKAKVKKGMQFSFALLVPCLSIIYIQMILLHQPNLLIPLLRNPLAYGLLASASPSQVLSYPQTRTSPP